MQKGMMWAQTLIAPGTFARQEVPIPQEDELEDGDVLLRVLAGGICGSDLPYFKGGRSFRSFPGESGKYAANYPGFPMHEVVGEVVVSHHPNLKVGAYVVGWDFGMNALAEYSRTKGDWVFEYDKSLPPTKAIMIQPVACVIYALEQLPGIAGASIAVIGLGPIGVLFSHVLKSMGAGHVTGIDRVDRSDLAKTFGIDEAIHSNSDRWALSLEGKDSERPEVIIEAVGHQVTTLTDAISAIGVGGRILYYGVPDDPVYPLPMFAMMRKNLTLSSGVTLDRPNILSRAGDYLKSYSELFDAYITNHFRAEDVQKAFELAIVPSVGRLKIVLSMT